MVTGANADDGTAAPLVIERMAINDFPRMQVIYGDNKYNNKSLNRWMERERPAWSIEVQKPPQGSKGFNPIRIRWVVERSNAWHSRCRRNSKDYERRPDSSESMIKTVTSESCYEGAPQQKVPILTIAMPTYILKKTKETFPDRL